MGRLSLEAMLGEHGPGDRRVVLEWHLLHNHFPPYPRRMIPFAEAAIEAMQAGEPERRIKMPEGMSHVKYGTDVPANVIVETLHLGEFLRQDGK